MSERRRRYRRQAGAPAAADRERTARELVEAYVRRALEHLPEPFAHRLENVEIAVRRRPGQPELRRMGLRRGTLYGLYQGVPLPYRTSGYHLAAPDKITVFWEPLLRDFPDDGRLEEQVRRTVLHEIAHHFGIGDGDLRGTSVR